MGLRLRSFYGLVPFKTAHPEGIPMPAEDFDLDTTDSPIADGERVVPPLVLSDPPWKGLFVVFGLTGRRMLELHIPNAMGIKIGGPSEATEPSFILREPDGSIAHSGTLVME